MTAEQEHERHPERRGAERVDRVEHPRPHEEGAEDRERAANSTSDTFQTFSIPRFSWIWIEWMNAVAASHGISAAFSTASQPQ